MAVVIEVQPDGAVGVDPIRQARAVGDARETLARVVVEKFRAAPLEDEEVLVAVVIEIAPDSARANARARLVQVGDAHLLGNVLESAVPLVAVQAVAAAPPPVYHVKIPPAVPVEIYDRDHPPPPGNDW